MRGDSSKRSAKVQSIASTGGIVLLLFVVFVVAVRWFRSEPPAPADRGVESIVHVLKPDPISQAVIDGAIDTQSRDAQLYWMSTGERVGIATRGEKDDRFYFETRMSLPEIDRELYYYQVWLLQRLPYHFFSVGELVTDEDGYFVLEWEAPDDEVYSGYTQVIVTRNIYGESTAPEVQLIKGVFGE